ncbi:MAG: hypothetical protein ACLP1X_28230 [Polyangiaceae bacterium]|jgi:hypothetical protein
MKLSLALVCTVLLGTACSSSSSPSSSAGGDGGEAGVANEAGVVETGSDGGPLVDASSGDAAEGATGDASGDAADGAVTCNALANGASPVTGMQVAENPPTLAGGTPVNGTYFLTSLTIYTGPEGPAGAAGPAQTTIQISGSTIQVVTNGTPGTRTEMFTASGTSFTATDTCPDTSGFQGTYTATATSFVVQFPGGTDDAGARTVEETFAKQ